MAWADEQILLLETEENFICHMHAPEEYGRENGKPLNHTDDMSEQCLFWGGGGVACVTSGQTTVKLTVVCPDVTQAKGVLKDIIS